MFNKNILGFILIVFLVFIFLVINKNYVNKFNFYVVGSGSMQPALSTGSLIMTRKMDSYYPGDTISFSLLSSRSKFFSKNKKYILTHRIVQARNLNSNPLYLTKGDANQVADQNWIKQAQIIGKVILAIPLIGFALIYLHSPIGLFIFLVLFLTNFLIFVYKLAILFND
ncbi:MAG: signal peptidase I [Patescibacteria group bacterium]|nr:signal peptidase I [Patescibacteria group bacterium]